MIKVKPWLKGKASYSLLLEMYVSCTVSNMFTLVRFEVSSSFLQG